MMTTHLQQLIVIVGGIVAALIAGNFSLLNLIIAKEHKISEFRQAWIDSLRAEIATYISAVQQLCSRHELYTQSYAPNKPSAKSYLEFHAENKDMFNIASDSFTKIYLRLNRREKTPEKRRLNIRFLRKLNAIRSSYNNKKFSEARAQCHQLRDFAIPLLKAEWDRVRDGEPMYQRAKIFFFVFLILLVGVGITLIIISII